MMNAAMTTASTSSKKSKRAAVGGGGPGSRSITLPAEAVHAYFRAKGFTEGVFGGEIVYTIKHRLCEHTTVSVYTTLPARSGGDSRPVGEDAIRVTAVYSRQTPGRDRPFVKVIHKAPRVYRTGAAGVSAAEATLACLDRARDRAREAYAAATTFLKTEKCFACEAKAREAVAAAAAKGGR